MIVCKFISFFLLLVLEMPRAIHDPSHHYYGSLIDIFATLIKPGIASETRVRVQRHLQ